LLLFGLAAQHTAGAVRSGPVLDSLGDWAGQTLLEDPQGFEGESGLYVVEVAQDRPVRRYQGPMDGDFRGWVLLPPTAFFEQIERGARDAARARGPSIQPRQLVSAQA